MSKLGTIGLLASLLLAACAAPPSASEEDPFVAVKLVNSGSAPMRCQLMFGHWVERDLGVLAPGGETGFTMQQARKDGALYIMRDDRKRLMMIENLFCGRDGDWQASVGQLDLAPARTAGAGGKHLKALHARCAVPASSGHAACDEPELVFGTE